MPKKIAYTVMDDGVDGKENGRRVFASFSEEERDDWFSGSKNKNFYRKDEEICDEASLQSIALGKLDAVERLVLGINPDVRVKNVVLVKPKKNMRGEGKSNE